MTLLTAKKAFITLAAAAVTYTASAQTTAPEVNIPKTRQEQIMTNFRTSMKSEYSGIVEGTIYNIVVFKKYFPDLDYSPLLSMLNKNAEDNDDAALRYKAHLAAMYLTNNADLQVEPVVHPMDHEYIFRQIADQLEKKFLVTNEN